LAALRKGSACSRVCGPPKHAAAAAHQSSAQAWGVRADTNTGAAARRCAACCCGKHCCAAVCWVCVTRTQGSASGRTLNLLFAGHTSTAGSSAAATLAAGCSASAMQASRHTRHAFESPMGACASIGVRA
jgi:hypothetical protein